MYIIYTRSFYKMASKSRRNRVKFKFTKEQNRDLQTAFEIFDKDGTVNIYIKELLKT